VDILYSFVMATVQYGRRIEKSCPSHYPQTSFPESVNGFGLNIVYKFYLGLRERIFKKSYLYLYSVSIKLCGPNGLSSPFL